MVKRDVAGQLGEDSRDKNGLKPLSCEFWDNVLCSFRRGAKGSIMQRCFECGHYLRFMAEMDVEEEEEDAKCLQESERVNRFAKCSFEDCLCDGENGKLACFGFKAVGDGVEVWKCRRFDVKKLKADSLMREAYLSLVDGVIP